MLLTETVIMYVIVAVITQFTVLSIHHAIAASRHLQYRCHRDNPDRFITLIILICGLSLP